MKLTIIPELHAFAAVASALQHQVSSEDICSSSLHQHSHLDHFEWEECGYISNNLLNSLSIANSSSTWTSQSDCYNSTESFCVFSSKDFAGGRGISILTTPDRIKNFQELPSFVEASVLSGVNEQPSPPFEEKELPGRGRGLIANKMLHRGDRIFAHTPIMMLDGETFTELEKRDWLELEQVALNNLPVKTQKLFMTLFGRPVTNPVSDRIDTNAFQVRMYGTKYYAVFPEIARLNHDCRPNAVYFFDKRTLTQYVHVITDITPGTEITITYINPHMSRDERLKKLSSIWGFDCSCSLCTLHPELSRASDDRLAQINSISDRLEKDWETASPEMAQTLISLYEQERLHAPASDAYWYAAITSCAEGKYWDTIRYARLAIEFGMLDYGFGDKSFDVMNQLAEDPEKEYCWLRKLKV